MLSSTVDKSEKTSGGVLSSSSNNDENNSSPGSGNTGIFGFIAIFFKLTNSQVKQQSLAECQYIQLRSQLSCHVVVVAHLLQNEAADSQHFKIIKHVWLIYEEKENSNEHPNF